MAGELLDVRFEEYVFLSDALLLDVDFGADLPTLKRPFILNLVEPIVWCQSHLLLRN